MAVVPPNNHAAVALLAAVVRYPTTLAGNSAAGRYQHDRTVRCTGNGAAGERIGEGDAAGQPDRFR